MKNVSHYCLPVILVQILFYDVLYLKTGTIYNKSISVAIIHHNSQQRLNLESKMEMMSVWREQISNVITV